MNILNKDSFKVLISNGQSQNVKEVAVDLFQSIKESNLKCSITGIAMLQFFLQQCGVDMFGDDVK